MHQHIPNYSKCTSGPTSTWLCWGSCRRSSITNTVTPICFCCFCRRLNYHSAAWRHAVLTTLLVQTTSHPWANLLIYSAATGLSLFPNNQERTRDPSWRELPGHSSRWRTWRADWLPVIGYQLLTQRVRVIKHAYLGVLDHFRECQRYTSVVENADWFSRYIIAPYIEKL